MGAAARELAGERYSWPHIARRLEEIYARVAGLEPGADAGGEARAA
jgi:hypothetical protein